MNLTRDEIIEAVNNALVNEIRLDPAELSPEKTFYDDLGLDSLDIVDMVVALEQAFGFKLPDRNAVAGIVTLDDLCAFIKKLRDDDVLPA